MVYIFVPCIQGMGENWEKYLQKTWGRNVFQGRQHHQGPPGSPQDRDTILQKGGVLYRFMCGRVDCDEEYIGESGRAFAERFREHMKAPSPIHDHHNINGNELSLDNFSIVGREDQSITRTIKEAIIIRVNYPSINRNIGKYQLPHI